MYFRVPFATSGDVTTIPVPTQLNGSISFTNGWGSDYSLNLTTNPNAKAPQRTDMNELFFLVTSEIQQYQQNGVPFFITTSDNGGAPYPYAANAFVIYDDGTNGNRVYRSLVDNNVDLPSATESWQVVNFCISGVDTGSPNALELNTSSTYQNFMIGDRLIIQPANPNTGATTVQVGDGAPIAASKNSSSGVTAFTGGELAAGSLVEFIFNGSVWVIQNLEGSSVPVGAIIASGGSSADSGYLDTDGSAVSRTAFSALFARIGTTFGAGDGVTTFNVPNCQRRVLVGSGGTAVSPSLPGVAVGSVGGEELHLMTLAELVSHSHVLPTPLCGLSGNLQFIAGAGLTTFSGSTNPTGGSTPFNVMQPSLVTLMQIKY